MKKSLGILMGLGFACAANAAIIEGQIIGIDFGSVAPADPVNTFNNYSDVTISNGVTESFAGTLVDTTGANVTGVGFSVSNATGQVTGRALASGGLEGAGLMTHSSVYSDWLISNNASGFSLTDASHFVFTFTGLDDSLTYNLTGGYDNNNIRMDAIWAADGQSLTTAPQSGVGAGYGTLAGLSTDGSGNLEITVHRNDLHVAVGGLTLEAIPEPATLGMVAAFGGAILFIRRRFSI